MARVTPAAVLAVIAVLAGAAAGCGTGGAPGAASTTIRPPSLRSLSAPPQAPQIPRRGAYFGAWIRQGPYNQSDQILALDDLQGELGRRLDIVHTYLRWQTPFPTASDTIAADQGSMLLVSWAGADSEDVAAGRDDSVIRQTARELRAIGKPIFLEWRWEMDRPNLRSFVGSPAEFIAAWKHVRAIFARQHASNVSWVWCPTGKGFAPGGQAAAYYPGDSQVDWICADTYPGRGPYRSFAAAADPFLLWASHHRKPVMIGEYGVQQAYGAQERAQWLAGAARTVQEDPQVKALVYFDANTAGATANEAMALTSGTAPLREFARIADSSYFNPRRLPVAG